jgi:hypothetical protein
MKETGSIKFNCDWQKTEPLPYYVIAELNHWRDQLYALGLLGENPEGIGYGNISMRYKENSFFITGSATGKLQRLTEAHYTTVTTYDLNKNSLTTEGPILASSESMTHAIIYETLAEINCVMHVHHYAFWKKLLQTHPSTNSGIEYGTPAMAREIQKLFKETDLAGRKLFAMAGHAEGIVSFGCNAAEAGQVLLDGLDAL